MTSSEKTRGARSDLNGAGLKIAAVCGRFNDFITDALLENVRAALGRMGGSLYTTLWVPGAFEIPLAAKLLAKDHDAVIAIGAVIRGDTAHFDFVAGECASGCMRVQLDTGVPVVFGVLTTDTVDQAKERIPHGTDYAEVAVEMARLVRSRC